MVCPVHDTPLFDMLIPARRWIFYIFAIIIASLVGLLCLMRESRPSYLLTKNVEAIRRDTGLDFLQPLNHDHTPDLKT